MKFQVTEMKKINTELLTKLNEKSQHERKPKRKEVKVERQDSKKHTKIKEHLIVEAKPELKLVQETASISITSEKIVSKPKKNEMPTAKVNITSEMIDKAIGTSDYIESQQEVHLAKDKEESIEEEKEFTAAVSKKMKKGNLIKVKKAENGMNGEKELDVSTRVNEETIHPKKKSVVILSKVSPIIASFGVNKEGNEKEKNVTKHINPKDHDKIESSPEESIESNKLSQSEPLDKGRENHELEDLMTSLKAGLKEDLISIQSSTSEYFSQTHRFKARTELQLRALKESVGGISEHISKLQVRRNREKSDLSLRMASLEQELGATSASVKQMNSALNALMNSVPGTGYARDILNFSIKMRPGTDLGERICNQLASMRLQEGKDMGQSLKGSRNETGRREPIKSFNAHARRKETVNSVGKRKVRFWEKPELHASQMLEYRSIAKEGNKHRRIKSKINSELL
eukprot:TRINITY_DN16244_c0_g1_i5.p1 TRINITY_DN16244_c0_g1~~TRINITY_DN16244_c0_g1_i5.p1  ORF type:complete len:459 (-),score=95.90 TRINITY_DN16244_c0_g1_i5:93-1469(-)